MTSDEIKYEGKKYTLYFDEDTHTYFLDGNDENFTPVISVTQILSMLFPDKYAGISKGVLQNAANRGTIIHNAISDYEVKKEELDLNVQELRNYMFLKKYYCLKCIESEKPIILNVNNTWIAGRFDMLAYVKNLDTLNKEVSLIDIKTTTTLDIEYLMWQLNIYRLAYQKCNKREIKSLYGLHLKNDKRKMQPIAFMDNEKVIKKLERLLK